MRAVIGLLFCLFYFQSNATGGTLYYIYGKVTSKGKTDTLEGASVIIRNAKIGTSVDNVGSYKLIIPNHLLKKYVSVEFQFIGFITVKKKLRLVRLPKKINVELKERTQEIITVTPSGPYGLPVR